MDQVLSFNQELLQSVTIRKWSALASWAVLVYEYVITFNEEIRHIWCFPVTAVRLIYLISRYFALVVQSLNVFLVLNPLSSTDIPEKTCRKWFALQIATMCVLMGALDSILMLRVYALHQKNRRVGVFLAALFCVQIGVEAICGPHAVNVPYNTICDSLQTPPAVGYYCASVWVTHITLGVLTAVKYDLLKLKIPIVQVVTRDGAWITVIVCSIFTTIVPWALIKQVTKAHITFGWPITIVSISCCRMIMNMQTIDIAVEAIRIDPENLTEITSELQSLQIELKG